MTIESKAHVDEPAPVGVTSWEDSVQCLVCEEFRVIEPMIRARADVGRERYGTFLAVDNGRDAEVDALQEILDFIVYARQAQAKAALSGVPEAEDVWKSRVKRGVQLAILIGGLA